MARHRKTKDDGTDDEDKGGLEAFDAAVPAPEGEEPPAEVTQADAEAAAEPAKKKFHVECPNTNLQPCDVEAADEAGAVEEYKNKLGVWSLPGTARATPAE